MTYLRASLAALVLVGGIIATHSFSPKIAAAPHWPLRSKHRSCAQSVRMTISTECTWAARLRLSSMWAITKTNVPAKEFTLPRIVFQALDGSQSIPVVSRSDQRAEFPFS